MSIIVPNFGLWGRGLPAGGEGAPSSASSLVESFTQPDGPIGPDVEWATLSGTPVTVSNILRGGGARAVTPLISPDMNVQGTLGDIGAGTAWLFARANPDNLACYFARIQSGSCRLGIRSAAGAETLFSTFGRSTGGYLPYRLYCYGSNIRLYQGPTLLINHTNTAIPDGVHAGVQALSGAGASTWRADIMIV